MVTPDTNALRSEISRAWLLAAFKLLLVLVVPLIVYLFSPVLQHAIAGKNAIDAFIAGLVLGCKLLDWLYQHYVPQFAVLALLILSKFYAALACTVLLPMLMTGTADSRRQKAHKQVVLSNRLAFWYVVAWINYLCLCVGMQAVGPEHANLMVDLLIGLGSPVFLNIPTKLVSPSSLRIKTDKNVQLLARLNDAAGAVVGSRTSDSYLTDLELVQTMDYLVQKLDEIN